MGISAMMHGYMAFDKKGTLLTPFRTWRNTTTAQAAEELTELLQFNIPQRWSIAHLYQAVLNGEEHLSCLSHINTLAGYIHTLLTARFEVGLGEASGIFSVENGQYNPLFIAKTEKLLSVKGLNKPLSELLPVPRDSVIKRTIRLYVDVRILMVCDFKKLVSVFAVLTAVVYFKLHAIETITVAIEDRLRLVIVFLDRAIVTAVVVTLRAVITPVMFKSIIIAHKSITGVATSVMVLIALLTEISVLITV